VEALGLDPLAVAAQLEARIKPDDIAAWQKGDPKTWARETYAVAKTSAYTLGAPPGCGGDQAPVAITPVYEVQAQATAALQLEKAGVRLAWVLNRAFGRS
jgi:hypothetical protein